MMSKRRAVPKDEMDMFLDLIPEMQNLVLAVSDFLQFPGANEEVSKTRLAVAYNALIRKAKGLV